MASQQIPFLNPKCHCRNTSINCTINSTINTQGTYQNSANASVEEIASLVIAYLSNIQNNNTQADFELTLNPICLSWCDFLLLFYRVNAFSILPSAANSSAITFASQTFENTTSPCVKLNLAQFIKTSWADKCGTIIDNIPSKSSILLNKEVFFTKSLLNSNSAIALSLDQAINTLLINGEIAPADSTSSANVRFIVQYNYTFAPLNTTVQINFVYKTNIPCYKNLNICDSWCPAYSQDISCRSCGDLNLPMNQHIDPLAINPLADMKYAFDNESVSDTISQSGFDSVNELKDDKTIISVDSSKW
jgi:hypothetical protein